MRLKINFTTLLSYFLGGLSGLIVALLLLHLFYTLEMAGRGEHAFLYHWTETQPKTHALAILAGFVLTGLLTAGWTVIRDRLKAQEVETKALEEISQAKTEMVSFVSHQMRTPLSAVKFSIKMLLEGDFGELTQDQKELLNKTYSGSENLETLIDEFLDVSKLELGRLEISLKSITLAELEKEIKGVVTSLTPLARKRGIALNYYSSLNCKLFAPADLKRINQIIESLLENAITYTPAGGKIEIFLENDKNNFKFTISDTGIGIPQEAQSKIFSKFFRATNARKLQSTGSGLGLYLCQKFIDGHKGKIWFLSEEGKGTTFNFIISLTVKVKIEELFRKI